MNKIKESTMRHLMIAVFILFSVALFGARIMNTPVTIHQPDGTAIDCLSSGDEFFNYYHDYDGFTIIQDQDGYFYYAINDGDLVVPSAYRVGSVNPAMVGIQKHVRISQEAYNARRNELLPQDRDGVRCPSTGVVNNIVIYIRFSDQTEFTDPRSLFDQRFNGETAPSMYNYYWTVSYNSLQIYSHHYPVCELTTNLSYQDSHPRSYFSPYNASSNPNGYTSTTQMNTRKFTMLIAAINAVADQIPADMDIDADTNGRVDNVSFIIRGNSDTWSDLLWAHRGWMSSNTVYINDKRVWDYTFEPENQNDVNTVCHEMFHAIGAPDLYHYSYDGYTPCGPWDIMENGFGHMLAYMKYRYSDWISDIPEISASGTYTLHDLTSSTNNCYKVPFNNSSSEYLVLEYRNRDADYYEHNLPASGLIITRVNSDADGAGNTNGPPDELYVYRQGGTPDNDGTVSQAAFGSYTGRTEFSNTTDPYDFLSDETLGGTFIHQVGTCGETISFILDPGSGMVEGTVSCTETGVDLTQVDILCNGTHYHPFSDGTFEFNDYEGTYPTTIHLEGFGDVTDPIVILPEHVTSVNCTLSRLAGPSGLFTYHSGSNVTLEWGFGGAGNPNFTQFNIWRKINAFSWSVCGHTTSSIFQALDLNQSLTYSFYVVAEYANGLSLPSNTVTINWAGAGDETAPIARTGMNDNFPNPFNPRTTMSYSLAQPGNVTVNVYNLRGQVVRSFEQGTQPAGQYKLVWNGCVNDGSNAASGVYYAVMKVNGKTIDTHKMLLMK
jgi:M6 family metalloprotease-like protein